MLRQEYNFQGEKFVPYQYWLQTMAKEMDISIELVYMRIRDMKTPPVEVMVAILDEIDRCIEHNPAVYLHCWRGRCRTGTVIGC